MDAKIICFIHIKADYNEKTGTFILVYLQGSILYTQIDWYP